MAGKKRATGEGNIYQRDDGRWVGRLSLGKDSQGNRQRKVVYGRTQSEVVSKLESLREQRNTNPKSLLGKDTLGAFLKRWLENDVEVNKAATTHCEYELAVRLYVKPYLSAERLGALDAETLIQWQARMSKDGHSANTRLRAVRVLRNALNKAVKLQLIRSNPMAAVDKPRVTRGERIPLEADECHRLIEACAAHRVGDIVALAAMTGMRKRELFGLEWSAVNLSEGVLSVRKTVQEVRGKGLSVKEPKTKSGRRMITLGKQAIQALESRLKKALKEGFDPSEVPLVFPDSRGGYFWGSNFDRNVWHPIRKAAGLPKEMTFHDLRHTQASLLLDAGADMKVIQARLGHAKYETTANLYAHLLQGAQADASGRLDEMMERKKPKTKPVGTFAGHTEETANVATST
jgi:integrase